MITKISKITPRCETLSKSETKIRSMVVGDDAH